MGFMAPIEVWSKLSQGSAPGLNTLGFMVVDLDRPELSDPIFVVVVVVVVKMRSVIIQEGRIGSLNLRVNTVAMQG